MATVLFAWELGNGLGHVMRLKRLAGRLAPHGLGIVAAVKNLAAAHFLAGDGITLIQSPIWPVVFRDNYKFEQSSATFGDMLAGFGLADPQLLPTLLAAWDRLFAFVRPDIVVADYAPAAMLAARGRLPLAIVGSGFAVPPAEMLTFPLLHHASPPIRREQDILASVNDALRSLKIAELDRLPQMFESEVRSVQTFPILDPYRTERVVSAEGPVVPIPLPREAGSHTIFGYFASGWSPRADLIDALMPFGRRLRVFGPGLSPAQSSMLSNAGVLIETRPLPLSQNLARMSLLIHSGNAGLAAEALAAGVPQLALSVDIEKDLTGQALADAGVGRLIKMHDPSAMISTRMIEELAVDAKLALRASELGASHRDMLQALQPLAKFESDCLKLLH